MPFNLYCSHESNADDEVAEISKNHGDFLTPVEADVAPRLSPFSNLKERRAVIEQGDFSSSDDASPSQRPRATKAKSPLLLSGNRFHESQKTQNLQSQGNTRSDGEGGRL